MSQPQDIPFTREGLIRAVRVAVTDYVEANPTDAAIDEVAAAAVDVFRLALAAEALRELRRRVPLGSPYLGKALLLYSDALALATDD